MARIAFALLLAAAANAAFLTDLDLESQQCSSTAFQTVARVTVQNPPTAAIDILHYPDVVEELHLECFQIFESLSNPGQANTDALLRSCAASNAAVSICMAEAGNADSANWQCQDLAQYVRTPRTSTTYGARGQGAKMFKFQWLPQLTTPLCYPRDLTVQIVAFQPKEQGSSVAASVVFIIIVIVIGLGVVAFALYQVHKSMTGQFKRAELDRAMPPAENAQDELADGVNRALGLDDGEEGDEASPLRDDVYIDREDVTAVTVTDRDEVLESKPMPKPWYQRASYDGKPQQAMQPRPESISRGPHDGDITDRRLEYGAASTPHGRGSSIRRRHTPPERGGSYQQQQKQNVPSYTNGPPNARRSPAQFYDENMPVRAGPGSAQAGAGQRYPPHYDANSLRQRYDDEEDEDEEMDTVLVCSDCNLPIHGEDTPQFCEVTGMRHY
jgi:hypothetical protein